MEFELPLVHRFISPSLESLQGAEVQLPIAAYTERLALLFLFHFGPMRKVNEVLKYLAHWTREKIRVAGHGGHWGLAGRIWWLAAGARQLMGRKVVDKYRTVSAMILESGALYCVGGIAFVIISAYELSSVSASFHCLDTNTTTSGAMLRQLVGIAPTIIAVRVGLGQSFKSTDSFGAATSSHARRQFQSALVPAPTHSNEQHADYDKAENSNIRVKTDTNSHHLDLQATSKSGSGRGPRTPAQRPALLRHARPRPQPHRDRTPGETGFCRTTLPNPLIEIRRLDIGNNECAEVKEGWKVVEQTSRVMKTEFECDELGHSIETRVKGDVGHAYADAER
ncbi:hypothetical protein B0H13DRAFT_1877167 [Mycena leptocephala]|nr:hypothetical protein B0H13DRAFT_1877167 [Mycena leptocephala]